MAQLVFGMEFMETHAVIQGNINVNSGSEQDLLSQTR
jgi:hypothetical protein